jgi:hypothetical protein
MCRLHWISETRKHALYSTAPQMLRCLAAESNSLELEVCMEQHISWPLHHVHYQPLTEYAWCPPSPPDPPTTPPPQKLNPKGPDFAPKDREGGGTALWITDSRTPSWVVEHMDKLPAAPATRR